MSARIPALGAIRFDLVLGGLTLLSVLFAHVKDKWRTSIETTKRVNWFFLYVLLSLPLVTWPGSVIRMNLVDWIKAALFFVFVVTIIRTEKQLRWIILVFLACQAFRILEPLYMHVTDGYWGDIAYSHIGGTMSGLNRLSGAPHDVVNPNQLAWVIVTVVPFFFYLFWKGGRIGKIIFLTASIPFAYCLLLTGSRSGLLCLAFTIAVMIMMSENKMRNFVIVIVILIPASIYFAGSLSTEMQTRYLSIVDSDVAGADTAQGRVSGLVQQLKSLSNNPLFGNGLGTSRETNWNVLGAKAQMTHNLYMEILQESGIIGFILFMMYIASMIKSLSQAKSIVKAKNLNNGNWLDRMIIATQVWVVMNLFYSLSCFGLSSWEWYFFGGVATLCLVLAKNRVEEIDSNEDAKDQIIQNVDIKPAL